MAHHNDPIIGRLRAMPLFAGCTRAELALVSRTVTEHHATAGQVLIQKGRTGREFIVITEGTVTVEIEGRPIARLGPGDFVGEVALLDRGPRTATVVAETDLVALVSSLHEFTRLLAGAPNLARTLLVGLARRLRVADGQLAARPGAGWGCAGAVAG